jgi:hypothetical protein
MTAPGLPPEDPDTLLNVSVDPADMFAFWRAHYLSRFILNGGSKVKWIRGEEGAGKTHALYRVLLDAEALGYLSVYLDAGATPLRGMLELTTAVLGRLNRNRVVTALAAAVVRDLGYDPGALPGDVSAVDGIISRHHRDRVSLLRDLREAVDLRLGREDLDPNLRAAVAVAVQQQLGVAVTGSDVLDAWFLGERVPKRQLAILGMSQSLTRLNARAMLQGWAALARAAGLGGLVIAVDRFEQVVAAREEGRPYYTPLRRNETYEMLRQLIDDGDRLPGLFFVVAARPALFEDPKRGIPSYPALQERLRTEVDAARINRFQDAIDWEALFDNDPEALNALAARWAAALGAPRLPTPVAQVGSVSKVRRTVEAVFAEAREGGDAHGQR